MTNGVQLPIPENSSVRELAHLIPTPFFFFSSLSLFQLVGVTLQSHFLFLIFGAAEWHYICMESQ